MSTTLNNTMELLIQGQMENFVKKLAADGSLNEEQMAAAMVKVKEQVAELDVPAAPKRTRTSKVVEPEDRCMARVWAGGKGDQCKSHKHDGDYCKRCSKLAAVTEEPVQYSEEGKHVGLFWGRIDTDKPVFNNGFIAVVWPDDASKAIVATALKEGKTYHKFSGEMKKKGRKSSGVKKPRKSKKSAKKSISASVPRSKNAYMYFLGEKRGEVRAALLAESEDGKVPVSEVAKKVGAMWKALDDVTKAPYTELAAAAKAERDAKIAELTEAASKVEEEESVVSESTESVESTESAEEAALLMGLSKSDESVEDDAASIISEMTEVSTEDAEEEEEVEEHELADGTTVLKGGDGSLYDPESFDVIGKWNSDDNTLIKA